MFKTLKDRYSIHCYSSVFLYIRLHIYKIWGSISLNRKFFDILFHIFQCVVFSNNTATRVGTFCEPLGVDFISRAHKPFARAYAQAVEKLGLPIDQIAVIGDQIYTDVFGGNRAGALTCYVETLDRRFFWINVRYQLERGFIARGRRRMEARRHD